MSDKAHSSQHHAWRWVFGGVNAERTVPGITLQRGNTGAPSNQPSPMNQSGLNSNMSPSLMVISTRREHRRGI
jgi:hypothetical protein